MTCYNGFRNRQPPDVLQTVKGIPAEYIAELVRLDGITETVAYPRSAHSAASGDLPYCIGFDAEAAKIASLNVLLREGVALRLHSWMVGPMLDGNRLTGSVKIVGANPEAVKSYMFGLDEVLLEAKK